MIRAGMLGHSFSEMHLISSTFEHESKSKAKLAGVNENSVKVASVYGELPAQLDFLNCHFSCVRRVDWSEPEKNIRSTALFSKSTTRMQSFLHYLFDEPPVIMVAHRMFSFPECATNERYHRVTLIVSDSPGANYSQSSMGLTGGRHL